MSIARRPSSRCVRALVGCAAIALMILAAPSRASASPVGSFSYDVDEFFGPVFTIENFFDSPGTFTNVVVHLLLGANDVVDLSLGELSAGTLGQTIDDLSGISFDSASLDLTFTAAGSLQVNELTGLLFDFDPDLFAYTGNTATTVIDFTAEPTQSVPEPSTLLLVASGLAVTLRHRRSRTAITR